MGTVIGHKQNWISRVHEKQEFVKQKIVNEMRKKNWIRLSNKVGKKKLVPSFPIWQFQIYENLSGCRCWNILCHPLGDRLKSKCRRNLAAACVRAQQPRLRHQPTKEKKKTLRHSGHIFLSDLALMINEFNIFFFFSFTRFTFLLIFFYNPLTTAIISTHTTTISNKWAAVAPDGRSVGGAS